MVVVRRARAGLYASGRYRRGLRAYRRRMRAPLLMAVAPMFLFVLVTAATRKLDPWSFAAGAGGARRAKGRRSERFGGWNETAGWSSTTSNRRGVQTSTTSSPGLAASSC